jgi:hypothetical protein
MPLGRRLHSFLLSSIQLIERHRRASACPVVGAKLPERDKLTVILLNHKRPENVAVIARQILRAGFVGRLVISNNCQDYPIRKFVPFADSRLVLIDQDKPSGVGIRFLLARQYAAHYYLSVDDDIFLHPVQLQWIYWNLRMAHDRPHGIFGAALSAKESGNREWPFVHRRNATTEVDILNGLFAFTRAQVEEYFRLCGEIGVADPGALMNGEDIILSFSGTARPLIHNVGTIWECASAFTPGVALHASRPGFYEERWKLFSELRKVKPLGSEAMAA